MSKIIAKDLSVEFPRSPRSTLGGYVVAARALDKCRAALAGTAGEYHYDCPLDNFFFGFAEITGDAFKAFVATGASDDDVAAWIQANAKKREKAEIVAWNNMMRSMRQVDMPAPLQLFLEDYIPANLPAGKIVYVWFDVYDIEEKRI